MERTLRWAKRKPALATAAGLTIFLAIAGPIAAAVIAQLYHRQGELLSEKDNLITQYASNKQNDSKEIKGLRAELDLWNGRANPWQFWPPTTTAQPAGCCWSALVEQDTRLAFQWQQAEDVKSVHGYLAMAIMNDVLERSDEAIRNYESARTLLKELTKLEPASKSYAVALADCCAQLARLRESKDRNVSASLLEERRDIFRRRVDAEQDPLIEAGLFEAELDKAFFQSFTDSWDNLRRAEKIRDQFNRNLTGDPVALYQLACYLGGKEPILITRKE